MKKQDKKVNRLKMIRVERKTIREKLKKRVEISKDETRQKENSR